MKNRTLKSSILLMLAACLIPQVSYGQTATDELSPTQQIERYLEEREKGLAAEEAERERRRNMEAPKFDVDAIAEAIKEHQTTLSYIAGSNDPATAAIGYELAQVARDLLPAETGVIETTAAINSTVVHGVSTEEWNANKNQILANLAAQFDEIVVYDVSGNATAADNVQWGGVNFETVSLSSLYEAPKPNLPNMEDLARASVMFLSPSSSMSGMVDGGLFGRRRGNSCGQRNFQSQCYGGSCHYQQQYLQCASNCGGNMGGNLHSGSSSYYMDGNSYVVGNSCNMGGNSRNSGYITNNGRSWYNANYAGGGQTTLGATCCSRQCYGIGLQGERNSRFSDVKGAGFRQAFQRYEGPPFGCGRLKNFFTNPTCVQRARRRVMIVTGIAIGTGGAGAVPLIL